jgi:GNAT superfamily N-acetyltransferase
LVDLALARRLERAEGRGCAEFVATRAQLAPDSGATWIEVAGAYAMYDGAKSPVTQTFGLGLFAKVTAADLEAIEAFYRQRGAPVFHEVSPLADLGLLALLNERGYHPVEFTSVMFRPTRGGVPLAAPRDARMQARLIRADEQELWAQTAAQGWSELTELADSILDLMRVCAARPEGLAFLAELDGQPVAAGLMSMSEGVALLAGASTIPAGRRQGAQLALLASRLRYAAEHGCELAMMCTQPGSASQRNAERQGFRIAYTRIKWRLA